MDVSVKPGRYIVAVSGGVDSVVLLAVLAQQPQLDLVVAHFDHGIRDDSADDAQFVRELADSYDLPFVSQREELGPNASENIARQARYSFLDVTSCQHGNAPIITAHHQDDVLETAIHNVMRGTSRRGLTSLASSSQIMRPLLEIPKQTIIDYALQQKLSWREDTTNHDERYTRNYIRHRLLVRFDASARRQLLALIKRIQPLNNQIDTGLQQLVNEHCGPQSLDRQWFCSLPHAIAKEVLACWLRAYDIRGYDRKLLDRLTINCKVKAPGTQLDVRGGAVLSLSKTTINLICKTGQEML